MSEAVEGCPTEEALAALIGGELAKDATAEVHRHLRGCSRCQIVLAGLGDAADSLDEPPAAAPLMKPGVSVGRFRLERLAGVGGMGSVWAAHDPQLGRTVAIKVLLGGIGSDGDPLASRTRLLREAKTMARLSHPNLVPVFEVDEVQGRLFLVMELIEGDTLARWLDARHSLPEILDLFLAAGRGLAAAHAAGVVHRDFKPDNVLVGKDGRPRVTDFGLARGFVPGEVEPVAPAGGVERPGPSALLALFGTPGLPASQNSHASPDDHKIDSTLTPLGALLGTPAYMAPEQMHGQRATARSDLFAFCAALYEAVCGTRPFPAATLGELRKRVAAGDLAAPARNTHVPSYLLRELQRGLNPDPAKRHDSMEELLAALQAGRARAARRWVWPAAALALLLVGSLAIFAAREQRLGPARPRSLAVVAPRNSSQLRDADWIAPALAELLTSDLGGDANVRLISPAEVAAAATDLGLAVRGAAPDQAEAARLRLRLGADLVLGGTYSLGANGALSARLDVWKPRGESAALEQQGDEAHLSELAARLAVQARQELGMAPRPAREGTVSTLPASLAAARLYAQGLQLLRSYEAPRASELLFKAAALAPDSARIQAALAESLLVLRREDPARQAARRAFELRATLTREEQERVEVLYQRAFGNHDRAVELAQARWKKIPDDLDRGLEVADELILSRRWTDVLAVVDELHKLPPPAGSDPRIALFEARAALRAADLKRAAAAAQLAFTRAQAVSARWQMAVARYAGGQAARGLGDPERGLALFAEANALYTAVGDRAGAAGTRVMSATVLADRGDLPGARAAFEAGLATFRELGDRDAEAAVLHNLAVLLRRARELPAALDYAMRATTLQLEIGGPEGAAGSTTTLGNLRLDLGDVADAAAALVRAVEIRRARKDPLLVTSLFGLCEVRLLQGDFPAVHALLAEGRKIDRGQDKLTSARLHCFEAVLAQEEGRLSDAEKEGLQALSFFENSARLDEQARCAAHLAEVYLSSNRVPDARQTIDRAEALIAKSKSAFARGPVAVVDARVRAAERPKDLTEPLSTLRALADEGSRTGVVDDRWHARLALAAIELESGRHGAREQLKKLGHEARSQGFVLYALRAEAALRTRR